MSKLLYLQTSPRGGRSYSSAVADAFVESYREMHPEDGIKKLNVFEMDLPSFDGLAVQAKYTILHGKEHSQEELEAWNEVKAVIEEFKSADKYVMAVPMWNFGIPYRLKQYLDIIVQPGYTFSYIPEEGYKGLVTGKPIFIVYSRGGEYKQGSEYEALDLQKKYIETILRFIGFEKIFSVVVEPTLMGGPDVAIEKRSSAIEEAKSIVKQFQ